MSVRHLDYLFRPRSVAVIGASDRPHSVGATVIRNLLAGGFAGAITPVNLRHDEVAGVKAYRDVASLPEPADLAIICTPPQTIPGLIADLGARGTKAAIVLTAGLGAAQDASGRSLQTAMLEAAKPHLLRILGPNCVGLLVPGRGLNASFAHTAARSGRIAFVSQSGALATALLDWANSKNIGFSHFISMGDSADVDFGDVLDYLASDPGTRSILMYVESITAPRKFMSAARAAARNKPVLLVKSGRAPEGAKAAASHTGAMTGSDLVFDAAIRRAGMLRVSTLADLFVVAETLARAKPLVGDRLAVMTNGGGAGVLAADALSLGGGTLAALSEELMHRLDAVLPPTWSHGNPVDIIGDAPVARYVETLRALLDPPEIDSVLFMHAPSAIVPSAEIARACAPLAQHATRQVLGCWLGGDGLAEARSVFAEAGIPVYDTPEQAVDAFLSIVHYRRNQELLLQSPSSTPVEVRCDRDAARGLVAEVLADGRDMLTEPEAKRLLAAYGIGVVDTRTAASVDAAVAAAAAIARPVVLKILSPDISHKSDVGGVALGLETADDVRAAAEGMLARVRRLRPDAAITGFTVQEMIKRPRAHELIVGVASDPIFGPAILFGQGGTAVEAIADRAVALPPLNVTLARDLISRTRVARLLAGYRDRLPVNADALHQVLMQVSQLVCDLPEIVELDINPLLADDQGVIALDARVRIAPAAAPGAARLAIRPYPAELEESVGQESGGLVLRPIRPEDESGLRALIAAARSRETSAPGFLQRLSDRDIARLTQIDYEREMTFVAMSGPEMLAALRALSDPDNVRTEFAALVHPAAADQDLERLLVAKLIDYVRRRGGRAAHCVCRAAEAGLIAAATGLGFACAQNSASGEVALSLDLS